MDLRGIAKSIFLETQQRLELPTIIRQEITLQAGELAIGKLRYPLAKFRRIAIVALGKAAVPMADGIMHVIEPGLSAEQTLEGVVVGTTEHPDLDPRLHFVPGGHPTPDRHSIAAAEAILDLLHTCNEHCLVLMLLSGGASSMVDKPLDPGMHDSDLAHFHRSLVYSGLAIGDMNVLRKHFSAVKGGRLAVAAHGATICTLIVSDVPPGAVHVVGSGPSLPDPTTVEDCRKLIAAHSEALDFDPKIAAYFNSPTLAETPKSGDRAFRNNDCHLLLSSDNLSSVAQEIAEQQGFHVVVDNSCDEWDFRAAAAYLVDRCTELRSDNKRLCLISTGELSVQIQNAHGQGGRNQHFVLECARLIAERGLDLTVLSAGSDGVDGNSPAAGAVADRSTSSRAAALGNTIEGALESFDSYTFFQALGDAIVTGPSGNNLRDLRILLAE